MDEQPDSLYDTVQVDFHGIQVQRHWVCFRVFCYVVDTLPIRDSGVCCEEVQSVASPGEGLFEESRLVTPARYVGLHEQDVFAKFMR